MLEYMRLLSKIPENNFTDHKTIVYHQPMMVPAGSKGKIVDLIEKYIKEERK